MPEGNTVKLSQVDEDLRVGDRTTIECVGEGNSLKVEGEIRCEGRVRFTGSVSCTSFRGDDCKISTGSLSTDSLAIRDGSLDVLGDLTSKSIDVDKQLSVTGKTEADEIEVGGTLELSSAKARIIEVGGKFRSSSDVEAEEIDVGGTVEIKGKIKGRSLDVGGKALLAGGEISGRIDVGGVFESTGELNFGDIDVGGIIILGGQSIGGTIEVGGKLHARGDLGFKRLEVGGIANVEGKAEGERIELGGRLRIGSDLKLNDSLEVGGSAEVGGNASAKSVDIGGTFRSKTLRIETAEFRGHVRTDGGIFASRSVDVERRSRVEGWIRSLESISIETHADVDYVSAPKIDLGDHTRVRGAYAESLELGDQAEVLEEALYTHSIASGRAGRGFGWQGVEPKKVDSIPQEKRWDKAFPDSGI